VEEVSAGIFIAQQLDVLVIVIPTLGGPSGQHQKHAKRMLPASIHRVDQGLDDLRGPDVLIFQIDEAFGSPDRRNERVVNPVVSLRGERIYSCRNRSHYLQRRFPARVRATRRQRL